MKLSFVIPVYNVQDYLEECIESILKQNSEDCEIILVDDGSTDKSGMICDEYASGYSKIKVIHEKNSGHSTARNTGFQSACGEYIAFVDSDDKIFDNSLDEIYKWIDKGGADICFMHGYKLFEDGSIEDFGDCIEPSKIIGCSKEEVCRHIGTRPKYPGSACTKIFSRDFLLTNELKFPTDLSHGEDLSFCLDCFLKAKTFSAIDIPYYLYRQNRAGSMTNSLNREAILSRAAFLKESLNKLTDNDRKPTSNIHAMLLPQIAYEYAVSLWQYDVHRHNQQMDEVYNILNETSWVLKYGKTPNIRIIEILRKIFGLKFAGRIISLVKYTQKKIK